MKKILILTWTALMLLSCSGGSGNSIAKNGVLPGKFSVSNETQIQFSQGNLQYQPSTKTWRFAQNQFDTIGTANTQIADDYEGWIDLFGWGTGANPTLTSTDNQKYADYTEWGTNTIINGGENNQWRTLTQKEWTFLLLKRDDAKNKCGVGAVNGIDGLIILPDEWVLPEGLTFNMGFVKKYGMNSCTVNAYTLEQWKEMEKNGAVFLPEAGYRLGTKLSECGHYWTATSYNYAQAYDVFFSALYVQTDCHGGYSYAKSVRLVKPTPSPASK